MLPWSWAEQQLKKSHNYWITTVKPDGSPHTMVVWGLWRDGCFLFSTGSKSRKARNLSRNANCVVYAEHAHEAVIAFSSLITLPIFLVGGYLGGRWKWIDLDKKYPEDSLPPWE